MFMTYIHIKFTHLNSVVNDIKLKPKYTDSALHHSYVQPIITSPFAYEINNKLCCVSHTPDITGVRILKLNFAEKDHNCKPSLARSMY